MKRAIALSAGAPLGLLIVRLTGADQVDGAAVRRELQGDPPTYLYVLLSTLAVFAAFGYVVGRQADALVKLSRTDRLTGLSKMLGQSACGRAPRLLTVLTVPVSPCRLCLV